MYLHQVELLAFAQATIWQLLVFFQPTPCAVFSATQAQGMSSDGVWSVSKLLLVRFSAYYVGHSLAGFEVVPCHHLSCFGLEAFVREFVPASSSRAISIPIRCVSRGGTRKSRKGGTIMDDQANARHVQRRAPGRATASWTH